MKVIEETNLGWQGLDNSQTMGPKIWVELQNCYHNSIFITQKNQDTLQENRSKVAFEKRSLRPRKRGYRLLAAFSMAAFINAA